jgi:hypothetical protein
VITIIILLVIAASVITTTDAVTAIVFAVLALGILIWISRSGGGLGGWHPRRMGD